MSQGTTRNSTGDLPPRNDAHAKVLECGNHLALLLAVDCVDKVLHADEGRQPVLNRIG